MSPEAGGRSRQRTRTRKDLLQAAARLLKQGRKPSLDEIAEEAMVSRATAYRYFPSVDVLLLEAPIDVAVPDVETLFGSEAPADPIVRLERVDAVLHDSIVANESSLRMMLANSLQRGLLDDDSALPRRQNRRTPLIEAALQPLRAELGPATFRTLSAALALIIGTEAMFVFKDVLQIDAAKARRIKRWAIRALVAAARGAADKQDGV